MAYSIRGLSPESFAPLFALDDAALAATTSVQAQAFDREYVELKRDALPATDAVAAPAAVPKPAAVAPVAGAKP